jgi:hypothetical protein
MYVERAPTWWSPASSGIDSLLEIGTASTQSHEFHLIFCRDRNPFGSSNLSV